jgi:hypothetical protein
MGFAKACRGAMVNLNPRAPLKLPAQTMDLFRREARLAILEQIATSLMCQLLAANATVIAKMTAAIVKSVIPMESA